MSTDKLCYAQSHCSFNSESFALDICKISRLDNYQYLSYKQFSKATLKWDITYVDWLSVTFVCDIKQYDLHIIENQSDFQVVKNNLIFY